MFGVAARPFPAIAVTAALAAVALSGCGNETVTPPTPTTSTADASAASTDAESATPTTSGAPAKPTSVPLPPGVPSDFPTRVPQPEGFVFETGLKVRLDGKKNFTLKYTASGNQADAARNFVDSLQGEGFVVKSQTIDSDNTSGLWKLQGRGVNIGLAFKVVGDHTNLILNVTLVVP